MDIGTVEGAEDLVASFLSNLFLEVAVEAWLTLSSERLPPNEFAQRWRRRLLTKRSALKIGEKPTRRSQLYEKVVLASKKVGLVGIPSLVSL